MIADHLKRSIEEGAVPPPALAMAELGMEGDPPRPHSPGGWLAHLKEGLGGLRADYGPGSVSP
ncbi:hypothetical protein [Streptomyces sp. WAC 04229]|uniref:hypothetical protein n=1 Tax=Streptomyces sp. WAC 04229 TaxID=2203206 RepID=UPI003D70514E